MTRLKRCRLLADKVVVGLMRRGSCLVVVVYGEGSDASVSLMMCCPSWEETVVEGEAD